MKITDIKIIEVAVPFHEGILERMNGIYSRSFVYKVHTDEGIIGIGEGTNHADRIPEYIGKNPFEFMNGLNPTPFQQAFYDIMGKSLDVPAYKLLGEKVRDEVPLAYWSLDMPPAKWAQEAKRAAHKGFRVHKIKARPQFDIVEQVAAISEVVPEDYKLRVDANGSFETVEKTVEVAKKLQQYNIESYESPIPQDRVEDYIKIKNEVDIHITIHFGAPPPITAIKAGMNDSFIIAYPDSRAANTIREAAISQAAGMPVWIQIVGLGITAAYVIHLGAVIKNATMPAITLFELREADIIKTPIEMKDGYANVSEAPGLGVELDEEALEEYRVK